MSTTSDSNDYIPLGISPILLSYDQKLALMEANGFNNQDNLVVPYAHMNLNAVDYEGAINQAPSITTPDISNVNENAPVETVIYDADATDPENQHVTYSLGNAGDSELLSIDSDNGEVRLLTSAVLKQNLHMFRSYASDGQLFDTQPVTVYVQL